MYWQWKQIRSGATWPRGGNYNLLLDDSGLLSSLYFHAYRAGVTDSMLTTHKWRLLDFISSVQVLVDGSDPIKQLTGKVAHYFQWLDGGGAAPDKHFNYGSSTKRAHGLINFGMYPKDPVNGLDLSRFKSVELNLTNDGTATYFAGDWAVDVFGLYLRDAPAGQFRNFFRTEEWRKWAPVADETKYLQLPQKYPLRRMVFQVEPGIDASMLATDTPYTVVDSILVTKKSGQDELFKGSLRHLWYFDYLFRGRDVFAPLEPYQTSGYGIWTGQGQTIGEAGLRFGHAGTQSLVGTTLEPGNDSSTQKRLANTDSDQDALLLMGLALENCAPFSFDENWDPAQYLDLQAEATVDLEVHTGSGMTTPTTAGAIRVMLDRMVPQP